MRVFAMAAMVIAAHNACSASFPTSDQNPLLHGAGLSSPWSARLDADGTHTATLTLDWSSIAAIQQSAREELVVDAESRQWRIELQRAVTDRFAVRLQLPYRTTNGGSLDGFIDDWHALFGQSEGDRPLLGKDRLVIDYRRDNNIHVVARDTATSGLDDIHLDAGYQIVASPSQALAVWSGVKLPIDNQSALTRNAIGIYLGMAGEQHLSRRWRAFGQTRIIRTGRSGILSDLQREWLAQATLGVDYLASRALSLTLQFDAHTAAYRDTPLELMGGASILTFGGSYRFDNGWHVQLGMGEDVKVEASPDVNFVFSIAKTWR